ncbi:MAG: 37S ribosomal protein S16, mitochondrial [Caeruleum heppii]|nr:MAG: 37S ribosomal protein S16, mitochondrial [Caeruleum heppii]
MVVKLRLARFGKRNAPFYNIVVAHARTARNSKPIEVLGTYDPIPKPSPTPEGKPFKDIKLDSARTKYWLGVGAQPSDPVWRLLAMIGLLEPRRRGQQTEEKLQHHWDQFKGMFGRLHTVSACGSTAQL